MLSYKCDKSVCLTEPKQMIKKNKIKIPHNSSPANLKYKPLGLMAENNIVCKTTRKKIHIFYCVVSHCTFHVSFYLFIDRTWKQTLLIRQFIFVFLQSLPSVSQTYKLQQLKLKIKFWNLWFYFFGTTLKDVLQKCAPLQLLSKDSTQICGYL